MFANRPWLSRPRLCLCLMALLSASFLFALPGHRACASTLTGSWYITNSNTSSFPSGSNYAQVTLSVDSADKATFNLSLLSPLTSKNFLSDSFAFNWAGSSDIRSQISTALANAGSPMSNWSVSGSNGTPAQAMDGFGKYNYQISATGNADRTNPVSFTMDLSGLGLGQSDIFNDLQVTSSGSNGSGLFAAHVAGPGLTFYLGGTTPVATPEPSAIVSMALAAGLLLCVFCWRYFATAIPRFARSDKSLAAKPGIA